MEESNFFQLRNGRYICDDEQSRILSEIIAANPFNSGNYRWDEMSMAELFADVYKQNTLYCPEAKSWYTYDGTRWVRDVESLETMDRLMTFVTLLSLYANVELQATAEQEDYAKDFRKFITKLSDRRSRDRMIRDAQTNARIPISKFDSNPYLVNCLNGTYDLRKNQFYPHRSEDYLTMIADCRFPTEVESVSFPRWDKFIQEITCDDAEMALYLQRCLGYSLVGSSKEECMFIAYGKTTRNGKGTLFNTIEKVLGDYAKAMPVDFICLNKYGSNNYDRANPMLAALKGVRFVTLSESKSAGELDEAIIKNYTGGDSITTRNLHEKSFSFVPVFKMWLSCNSLPSVQDRSVFSSDRLKVIEFKAHFDEKNRDTTLKDQFLEPEARSVIFKWLIEGYKMYKKQGLKEPKAVKTAVENYEKSNDRVGMFVEERCELGANYRIKRGDLYNAYKSWCVANGLKYVNSPRFFEQISIWAEAVKNKGNFEWKGIKLRASTIQLDNSEVEK